jgi:hypothetical protein
MSESPAREDGSRSIDNLGPAKFRNELLLGLHLVLDFTFL